MYPCNAVFFFPVITNPGSLRKLFFSFIQFLVFFFEADREVSCASFFHTDFPRRVSIFSESYRCALFPPGEYCYFLFRNEQPGGCRRKEETAEHVHGTKARNGKISMNQIQFPSTTPNFHVLS
jgi:hypothetical protein